MKLSINLASRRYLDQRALKMILSGVIVLLLFVLVIQGNAYLNDRQLARQHQAHLESLQEQLRGKLPKRLTLEELAEQRQAYKRAEVLLQRDAFRWTALFDRMESLLPDGVGLRSFSPDYDKNSLLMNGVAKKLKNLQDLLDNLQAGQFNQVYLKKQGEVKVDDGRGGKRTALSFSISLEGVF
ncbi:MAG: PilN domain-containing protein [Desulfuromonadales bacterium]|nr:PilN domain-containing protein [Desulfuromonadales bacterium]